MNQQRPLVPDGGASTASASSQGEMVIDHTFPDPSSSQQRKKKPGPKRDAKPAPSEKLERNRQAQRTHRERKEQYTKELELEVLRLKELFVTASRERDGASSARDELLSERDRLFADNQKLLEENQRMREIIQSSSSSTDSGYEGTSVSCDVTRNNSLSVADGYPGMVVDPSGPIQEYGTQEPVTTHWQQSAWELCESRGFASDGALQETSPPIKTESTELDVRRFSSAQLVAELPPIQMDYDDLAMDFVLSLERPCMGHIQYLHVRAHNYQASQQGEMSGQPLEVPDDGKNQHISGHALMHTSPPYSLLMNDPGKRYPTQFPDGLRRDDLLRLLDLSSQLEVNDPELPPVKAWMKIMQDQRFRHLGVNDFSLLKETLLSKVHCYRFGAIVEQNDLEFALEHVLTCKGAVLTEPTTTAIPASMAPRDAKSLPPGTAL
ncbi:hypothetical protein M409DRAFT_70604 [Zasmidium cellare ATCC 36951]|uniref:BZIP domain-containing protein n=1 Tax=Zasmidium cellare ATCC 36951 TaxID=1080233 RepID=A0A6A6C061_ZASCE|nr:uncharacterized protein M409DRAFT_70604 [Zasmidium cellare ATCC 36951]KAF2160263.1 hypothetical protein M409DRAFT_70604 [Zasmidium cellare ATCC 36951]